MKYLSLLVLFLLGFCLLHRIGPHKNVLEKAGFSFPIAFGINSVLMFIANVIGISVNNGVYIILAYLAGICLIILSGPSAFKGILSNFKESLPFRQKGKFRLNLSWLFIVGLCLYVIYAVVAKALLWPVFIYDSIAGYDFLAKAIALEGSIQNSVFDTVDPLYSVRALYPPLIPYSYGYAYIFGFESSKIVSALFYVSLALSFYMLLKKYLNRFGAALITLVLLTVPEFTAFSALSSPNPPCAFYCSVGAICIFLWYESKDRYYFILGTLLLVFALWVRSESIIFAAGAGLLILIDAIRRKKVWLIAIFTVACIATFLTWQFYMKDVLGVSESQPLILKLYWDYPKLSRMMDKVWFVTFKFQYYGYAVYLFLAFLLLNVKEIWKRADKAKLLLLIFTAWIIYLGIYYQIDTDYRDSSITWIRDGYKRGLLHFMPLLVFYIGVNKVSRTFFNKYLSLEK